MKKVIFFVFLFFFLGNNVFAQASISRLVGLYDLQKNIFVFGESQELKQKTRIIKKIFEKEKKMGGFVFFYHESDLESDKAGVFRVGDKYWGMDINLGAIESIEDFLFTLVHEFAHIYGLTLLELEGETCFDFFCSSETELEKFFLLFWEKAEVNNEIENLEKFPDFFVSDYSAVNPAEDMAETFSHFVWEGCQTKDIQGRVLKKMEFFRQPNWLAECKRISQIIGEILH